MNEVHDTQNRCQGTFGDLGRFEDPEFFRRNIVVKAVLRCSMYSLFLFGHDLGSQNTDPELGRIPVLRSLYPGHIYVHGGYAWPLDPLVTGMA